MNKQNPRSYLPLMLKFWGPLIGLLLIAFALRIFRLDDQSLWWDEGISLHLATSSWTTIILDRINNIHPPLYFFILKIWLHLTGVNPFSARYLSVLASWLQMALLFALLRRWFGGRARGLTTAWVGGLLLAFSAVAIIYGQETRVYAFLPLVFLALLAFTYQIVEIEKSTTHAGWRLYFGLGIVTWVGLHLHYIVAFMVVYLSLWAGIVFLRKRLWGGLWRWLVTYILVGVTGLPWFAALLWNWTAVQSEANAGTFATEPVPLDFLVQQVWVFHLTGLAGALADPLVHWLAGATAVIFLILLTLRLISKPTRRTSATLLAHWLVPLASALLVWRVRSFSHPRYVVMYTVGLTLLVAYLIWPGKGEGNHKDTKDTKGRWVKIEWWEHFLGVLLAVGLLLMSGWGLFHYYFDADTAKDDVRAVARYLEETAVVGDLILIPDTDYSLQFEYDGAATVVMPVSDQADLMWPHLATAITDIERVFVLDYARGTRDWQGVVPFVLESAGTLVEETEIDALVVGEYWLETAVVPPEFRDQQTRFGPLKLTGASLEQDAPANSAVTVALQWTLAEPVADQLNLALRLHDESGWALANMDALLLDGNGRPTDQWAAGTAVTTYHVLPLKMGLPPMETILNMSIYTADDNVQVLDVLDAQGAPQGQEFELGKVALTGDLSAAFGIRDYLVKPAPQPIIFALGLKLLGSQIETPELLAGQDAWVQFLWQLPVNNDLVTEPSMHLLKDGEIVVSDAGQPRFPLLNGQAGTIRAQRRSLRIPADVMGELTFAVQIDDTIQPLGNITVKATDRLFTEPTAAFPVDVVFASGARLVGYELPKRSFATDEPVPLTLYWEALADGATDFTVFTHLLAADGQLIGQHDAAPVNGTRPTSTWMQGEFVTDEHNISLREENFEGTAQIEIGFYDPQTGERLQTEMEIDFFLLPEVITFESNK